ncbi:putative holin-like toxin [Bacillus subtilis]
MVYWLNPLKGGDAYVNISSTHFNAWFGMFILALLTYIDKKK